MQTTGQKPQAPAAKVEPPSRPVPPPEFQAAKILAMDAAALAGVLKDSSATVFQKAKACQRLATVGGKDAVPALAALLTDPQLGQYARYGLEPIPDPSADDALRGALRTTKGLLLVGVLNSIRYRRDAKAVPEVGKLVYSTDPEVARAAAAALGGISGLQASKALQDGLRRTKGPVRTAVADAGLLCAEGLLAKGERDQALALYTALSGPDIPKPVRLAAMHGIIAAETSLSRPR